MNVPIELKVFLIVLVTQGVKSLGKLAGKDVGGVAAAIAAFVVGTAIELGDKGVALLPHEWQPVVVGAVQLVSLVLAAFGLYDSFKSGAKAVAPKYLPDAKPLTSAGVEARTGG